MKRCLFLILMPWCAFGMDELSALSMVESGNNDYAVGRAGEISRYQVKKREWHSVTNSRAYTNPNTAATVARRIWDRRIEDFSRKYHRSPTAFELYALWNAPTQVLRGRISPTVAERSRRFSNLYALQSPPTLDQRFAALAPH